MAWPNGEEDDEASVRDDPKTGGKSCTGSVAEISIVYPASYILIQRIRIYYEFTTTCQVSGVVTKGRSLCVWLIQAWRVPELSGGLFRLSPWSRYNHGI